MRLKGSQVNTTYSIASDEMLIDVERLAEHAVAKWNTIWRMSPYREFTTRLKLLIGKNPHLITTTLGNIFSMRSHR